MFWRFGGYANVSTIDTLLEKQDVTIEELLEESDLIQELKQQNSKLIEYLRNEEVLERLLGYVIAPRSIAVQEDDSQSDASSEKTKGPLNSFFGRTRARSGSKSLSGDDEGDEGKEEKQRLKYAYTSCEILSSEVWSISEALLENHDSLRKFWEYIKDPVPLEPVQAGYFTKVNEALLDRKTEEMLEFFKSIDNVVAEMLKHVDCPVIMDLLLKIISLERSEGGQGIVDWLQSQNLIPILLSYLSPENSPANQTSAGDFLKAIITISANATTQDQNVIGPNELTRQLVSESCVQTLISDMLQGGNPLTVGVGIVIEVIRKNNSDYDLETQIGPVPKSSDPIYLGVLLRQFAKHIPDFMELILNPKHKKELKAAFGGAIEPLGFDRFKTCELMAELLHCSNMALLNERGSEADIRQRDAERERLKAEGKLGPTRDNPGGNEFSTSVDSSGFHHAQAPSDTDESPEEIKRLEVSNNTEEEEFENVAALDIQSSEEFRDEFDEKDELVGEPLVRSPNQPSSPHIAPLRPKSPQKASNVEPGEQESPASSEAPQSKPKTLASQVSGNEEADSPTGLSDKVSGLGLDIGLATADSSIQIASGEQKDAPNTEYNATTERVLSPHPEDKPAPLFSSKPKSPTVETAHESTTPTTKDDVKDHPENPQPAPVEGAERSQVSSLANQDDSFNPHYEVDIDGTPVVGDLLKMMFVDHRVVPTILDFFFRFPWNNFLHNVVYDVVQQVFNGQMDRGFNRGLAIDLFETGRITERITEGQKASDKVQAETNMRLGYMGHLTLIAEEVVKFTERHPPELISKSVLDKVMSQSWIEYVEQTLAETRERDNAILGGVRPDMAGGPSRRDHWVDKKNSSSAPLDTMDLSNTGAGYSFSGGSLLSGFTNSSDEEDEEMEEGESEQRQTPHVDDEDQSSTADTPSVPAPLQIPPSRARRQFAMRLAQRKKEKEEAANAGDHAEETEAAEGVDVVDMDTSKGGNFRTEEEQRVHNIRNLFSADDSDDDDHEEKVVGPE